MNGIFCKTSRIAAGTMIVLALAGCVVFQTPAERIPERENFSVLQIKQGSIEELRESYSAHYEQIAGELEQLEQYESKSVEHPLWLERKIENHKKYLAAMYAYRFLCPSHQVTTTVIREMTCSECDGSGKTSRGGKCLRCAGRGTVLLQESKPRKCPYCGQFYRGSISGRELHEN